MSFTIETIRDPSDQIDLRVGTAHITEDLDRFLVFVNGRTEWIEKYDYMLPEWKLPSHTGYLSWDHRGQGASGGPRSFVRTYDDYAKDMQQVLSHTCHDKPYAIVAHSMGSLISLYATLFGFIKPRCLVLSSPLLGLPNEPVPKPIAKPLASLLTMLQFGKKSSGAGSHTKKAFPRNRLTHDYDLFMRMRDTPYPIPGASFGWVTATFRALDKISDPQVLKNLDIPILVLAGTEESVVDADSMHAWVTTACKHSQSTVKLRMISGAKHELFSEIPKIRQQATTIIRDFLAEHFLDLDSEALTSGH